MPTYDYRCRDCGHTIEIIHSILEDGPEVCERCRGPMQRVLHPAGVIFRGSGFYVTDSRSSKARATGESAGASGASTGGSGKDSSSGSAKDSSSGSAKEGSSGAGGTPAAGSDSGGSGKE